MRAKVMLSLLAGAGAAVFPLEMPGVRPRLPRGESYLCTGVAVPSTALHITAFRPRAATTAHHLMVIGCSAPVTGLATNLWNCGGSLGEADLESPGSACPGSAAQVLYMWAGDAGPLVFPAGVSLAVGGGSRVQHLVLQVHYRDKAGEGGDWSGVEAEYQTPPTPLQAGILSLHAHGRLAAHTTVNWDSACRMGGEVAVQPWAWLGHTHSHGRLVRDITYHY